MKRFLLVFGVLACSVSIWGQSAPVTMNEEPHHERLIFLRHMRVFEVNLPAGETTGDHMRDHDVATLALGDATTRSRDAGGEWGAPVTRAGGSAGVTAYTDAPAAHAIENVGTTPYRTFVVENLRDEGWSALPPLEAPGTTSRQQARSFGVYDVRLNADVPQSAHTHQNVTIVILLSGAVEVQGGGGEGVFRMEETGRWFPSSGADQPHTLTHIGTGDTHVVCIEAR